MTCQCICKKCPQDADPTIPQTPTLCLACALAAALNSPDHGVEYVPTVWPKLEPIVPISDERKDAAIEKAVEGLI